MPYDAEVEYLQSTGTAYIDTLVRDIELTNSDWELFIQTNESNGGALFGTAKRGHGCYTSDDVPCLHVSYSYQQGRAMRVNMTWKRYRTGGIVELHIKCKNGIVSSTTNGSAVSWGTTVFPTFTIPAFFLFGFANNGYEYNTVSRPSAQLGKCWLSVGGIKIFDLIPVRIGTTGYMYDKVSRQLLGNSGTGTFILGPDVISGGVVTNCKPTIYAAFTERRVA